MMNPLRSLLRATHCRSTHHFFALDALPLVATQSGERLKRLLLRYHHRYLVGATDPDVRFRDFQNHVVHVNEGYWGGAPRVAHQWYDRLQKYLRTDRWADAAHAAGVLSHYFTDPMQPLHTAHCDRERILHRPIEWSIRESYREIHQSWVDSDLSVVFQLSDRPGWLGEAILHGARHANQKYELLVNHYHLDKAVRHRQSGFDEVTRDVLVELFGISITGWARVLERVAMDAERTRGERLPTFSSLQPLLTATLKTPLHWWIGRVESNLLHDKVKCLYEEVERTGQLRRHLPTEVDIVHRVTQIHRDEQRWNEQREQRLASRHTAIGVVKPTSGDKPAEADAETPVSLPFIPQLTPALHSTGEEVAGLSHAAEMIHAPSMDPETTSRLSELGIRSVADFLAASPQDVAARWGSDSISSETVALWQTQATLMCEVPGLRHCDAQLLAGIGCSGADDLAAFVSDQNDWDEIRLHAFYVALLQYAESSAGRRYLCDDPVPSPAALLGWVQRVREQRALSPRGRQRPHRAAA